MAYDAGEYFLNLLIVSCAVLPVYHLLKSIPARQVLLIVFGMYALFMVAPRLVLFWPPYWVMIWGLAALLSVTKSGFLKSILLWTSIVLALLPLLTWKMFPQIFPQELSRLLHDTLVSFAPPVKAADDLRAWLVPVGLSFSTFRALDLLISTHLELVQKPKLREALCFGLFAPVLIVGPIIQFQELQVEPSRDRKELSGHIAAGLTQILIGFAKLFILALPLAGSTNVLSNFHEYSTAQVWSNTFIYSWYLYLNFAGYSDIAIGSGRLFGFRLRKNFNFPYFRKNLQEFWANWHMSLTSFAQRNVFIPMGGFRRGKQYAATFATMMVIALWHDFTISLVTFGVCHSFVLIALRIKHQRRKPESPSPMGLALSTIATYCFVAITIPLLLLDDSDIIPFYGYLIGWMP